MNNYLRCLRSDFFRLSRTRSFWLGPFLMCFFLLWNPLVTPQVNASVAHYMSFALSVGATLFLIPLVGAIPFSSSLSEDLESNFIALIVSRVPRKTYLNVRYIVNMVAGGLTQGVGYLLGTSIMRMFMPFATEYAFGEYFSNLQTPLMNGQYCTYLLTFCSIHFFSGAFCASMALMLSAYSTHKSVIFCGAIVGVHAIDRLLGAMGVHYIGLLNASVFAKGTWIQTLFGTAGIFSAMILLFFALYRVGLSRCGLLKIKLKISIGEKK